MLAVSEDMLPTGYGFDRDPSRVNRTEAALLSRGLDSLTSERLRRAGWTLAKLKQCSDDQLIALGIPEFSVQNIRAGKRSEIPSDNLVQVLIANRFACCVCHDGTKGIIVHHIREWAESYDHSVDNLAVLCLDHHDKAHSKSSISRNLDGRTVTQFKQAWEAKVQELDNEAVLKASQNNFNAWWYFNHIRLFELASGLQIDFPALRSYRAAMSAKLIDEDGLLRPRTKRALHMYAGGEGMVLYDYVRSVMEEVLAQLKILNVSDILDRGILTSLLQPGDFVFVQGAHVFASAGHQPEGRGQHYTGTRRANHVEFTFSFDRWEATSVSSWGWLSRRREAASILRIVNIGRRKSKLTLECTVIGISAAAAGLKQREYASLPYRQGVVVLDGREDEVKDFLADNSESDLEAPF
jgi:hypothetical protein